MLYRYNVPILLVVVVSWLGLVQIAVGRKYRGYNTVTSAPSTARRTSKPPCCKDMLSTMTCQRLQRVNEQHFGRRCNNDAEFRLIQCCSTCNKYEGADSYDSLAEKLVADNCFDRYGDNFCQRYVNNTDVWSMKQWSCDSQNSHVAFRSCRKSCGFCDFSKVNYTLQNALEACQYARDGWKDRLRRRLYVEKMNRVLP
uniref:ShKT domain-containing protein n=1 Tax=Panagrellus redivivus TaxID=6233 RepID=A0A7E4VWC1_PANRE